MSPTRNTIVGRTIPHDSAVGHVTGQANFIDDLPRWENELDVGLVGSPVASGRILRISVDRARAIPGVAAVLTVRDIPGHKIVGPLLQDESVLADRQVDYVGHPIVVIAAENAAVMAAAREAVELEIEPTAGILSIETAIAAERFIGPARTIARGDAQAALHSATHRLSGVFHSGGQEHFYLESQAALAVPGEQGQMLVHSSTQNTTEIQHVVAEVLGLGSHQVVCVCKRMGGAFGGKESQAALPAVFAALVAHHTHRPARLVHNKDDDMRITGKRHPYRVEWEVGFDDNGQIEALKVQFYSDGGAAADLSTAVMERSMLHAENAYFLPNAEIRGRVCFTNAPANTAFRGFGGPQAVAAIENILQEMAVYLKQDSYDLRVRNLYGIGPRNVTPYGQIVTRNHLPVILNTLAVSSKYKSRLQSIERSARRNPILLRGIAMTPVKFGISFTSKFLNQANALVNVYTDGTIQVSTGGTEMGQGLNTKIRQLVADQFGIGWQDVILMPTSTEKNNNTSPTAASAGTDLNGAAAVDACRQIRDRLTALAAKLFGRRELGLCESPDHVVFQDGLVWDERSPDATRLGFAELTRQARLERIDLGARGFYRTPGVDFNRETGRGNPFLYFTQGAAVAEVAIDRFTGELQVPRVDLLMDIGRSINPGIDQGQIIGGFLQGMGWVTSEALVYNDQGQLLSHSPTTYKIPAFTDVPPEFHCQLLDNDDNLHNICRSKAVGEPPLMLGIAVWAAVKDALARFAPAAKHDLRLPATAEEILRCITAS